MKNKLIVALSVLTVAFTTLANPNFEQTKPKSPEFDKLKTLVGTWTGKAEMPEGLVDMTIQFRLLAGGTVLEERCFIGTPNEMVTMYYEREGKIALTHYCVIGNRPGMVLDSADAKTMRFVFDSNCGINVAKETHMNGFTLTFEDSDTISTRCKLMVNGQVQPEKSTVLKRTKI